MIGEFDRFYFDADGNLVCSETISAIPEEVEVFWTVSEAARYMQQLGCWGKSLHVVKKEEHALALAVLRYAVEKQGEVFPIIYRGERNCGGFALEDHKILYGSTDFDIASAYGDVQVFRDVKAIKTKSLAMSIKDDGFDCDEEIIFFP